MSSNSHRITVRVGLVLAVAFLAGSLGACATTTSASSPVADLAPDRTDECTFLGDVNGSQYSGMLFAGPGLEGARNSVRKKAASMGATHVVWGPLAAGGAVQVANGRAYRCEVESTGAAGSA